MGEELNEPTQLRWPQSRERQTEDGVSYRPNQTYCPPGHSSTLAPSTGYVGGAVEGKNERS